VGFDRSRGLSFFGERRTMSSKVRVKDGSRVSRIAQHIEVPAVDRWEDDGGSPAPQRKPSVPRMGALMALCGARLGVGRSGVEMRTRNTLAEESNDGGGPTRRFRVMEWRWMGLGAIAIAGAIVLAMVAFGLNAGTVGVGLAYAGFLVIGGASPVVFVCLARWRAERIARRRAVLELPARRVGYSVRSKSGWGKAF
jgi:hypothetical protein